MILASEAESFHPIQWSVKEEVNHRNREGPKRYEEEKAEYNLDIRFQIGLYQFYRASAFGL